MPKAKMPVAPWQQQNEMPEQPQAEHPTMLLCHFSNGELEGLDNLQGGPSVDEFGIREYSQLSNIIKIPEVREVFHHIQDEYEKHGRISPAMNTIYEDTKHHSLPFRETPTEMNDETVRKLEAMGRYGDSKLAWIPYDLAQFLIELRHGPSTNPKSGLLEFGKNRGLKRLFKNTLRIAGSVGGALLGGPLGAGAGRALTGMVTGERPGQAFSHGLSHLGRAGIISGAGGALAHFAPGMAGAIGSTAGSILSPGLTGAAGNFFTGPMSSMGIAKGIGGALGFGGATGATGAAAAGGIPSIATSEVGKMGIPGIAKAAPGAAPTGGLGSMMGSMAVPAMMGALSYFGSKKQHKQDKRQHQDDQNRIDRQREEMGMNRPWSPMEIKARKVNPEFHTQDRTLSKYGAYTAAPYLDEPAGAYARGGLVEHGQPTVKSYREGVLIKGAGKGQDDKIRTTVPEGSYIIDASSTSMFGDGSSDAGAKVLKQFEQLIKSRTSPAQRAAISYKVTSKSPQLPVYLSNDEYKFDPITVSILGSGSNTKGSALLKQMVKNLRIHKNSNGDRLPPKAKQPQYYISKGR